MPALFVVLAMTGAAALVLLPPAQLERFGRSLMASSAAVSNIYFKYQRSGYFSEDSRTIPLIHTWSLGVEEQFYLVYPIFFWFVVNRFPRHGAVFLAAALLLSLSLAIALPPSRAQVAFYYLPPRGWEFLAGAIVASLGREERAARLPRAAAAIASWLGLAMLAGGFCLAGDQTNFPWPNALLPCFGTALLLAFTTTSSRMGRLLSIPPMRGVGLISYSLYLWHQPILALARSATPSAMTGADLAILAVATLLLAALTWRFVEQPFRGRPPADSRRFLIGAVLAAVALMLFGETMTFEHGLRSRFSPVSLALMDLQERSARFGVDCESAMDATPRCVDRTFWPPRIAILGDSHAFAFSQGLTRVAHAHGLGTFTLWLPGCAPVLGRTFGGDRETECIGFMDRASQRIASIPSIGTIVLTARWARHVELSAFDNGVGGRERAYHFGVPPLSARHLAEFGEGLARMIERFKQAGKRVILVGPVPEVGWSVPDYLWKTERLGRATAPAVSLPRFLARQSRTLPLLAAIARRERVPLLLPNRTLCHAATGTCDTAAGTTPFYFDDDHLSAAGGTLVARAFDAEFFPSAH